MNPLILAAILFVATYVLLLALPNYRHIVALAGGLGFILAVLMVTEAQRKLRSRSLPEAFRGLPITLIYIGILALAIFGFTGHMPAI